MVNDHPLMWSHGSVFEGTRLLVNCYHIRCRSQDVDLVLLLRVGGGVVYAQLTPLDHIDGVPASNGLNAGHITQWTVGHRSSRVGIVDRKASGSLVIAGARTDEQFVV